MTDRTQDHLDEALALPEREHAVLAAEPLAWPPIRAVAGSADQT